MSVRAFSRRRFLAGLTGLAGAAAGSGLLAACGSASDGSGAAPTATLGVGTGTQPSPSASGITSLGSHYSDEVPRRAMAAVVDAFTTRTGITVRVNTVDSASFQNQVAAYLQGTPDDVFTWFAGYRMRFFAERGLTADLSDLWATFGDRFPDGVRRAATASDGRQYLVPFHTYPWVVIYRPSIWADNGYEVPVDLEAFTALARRMESDGLVPLAFGNREGWPAMGTFDALDMRLNGYDFHIGLADGRERWTDPRVRAVFERWRELLPFHQRGALGRTWQDAARSLMAGEAGMYFAGTFAGEQADEATREDLDFFPFPLLGTPFDDERAIDAPVNGFMMRPDPADPDAARAFLEYLATGEAQSIYVTENPNRIAVAADADTSGYTGLQRKMERVLAGAGRLAQFLDRDTRPDFAGPTGLQAFLADFLGDPDQDLDALLGRIQEHWDSLTG